MARISRYRLAAAWLLTPQLQLHAQEKPPLVLTPATPWNVNYADDSCRLARTFVDGDKETALVIEQFEPGQGFKLLVAGPAFKTFAGRKVQARFGPTGAESEIEPALDATFGIFGPAVMTNMSLLPLKTQDGADFEAAMEDVEPEVLAALRPAEPVAAEEKAITWFELQRGKSRQARLALGPMDKPMAALRACSDELVSHWGIDVAAHRNLKRRVFPTGDPGDWLDSRDYPRDLLARGAQGVVQFRLMVDESGKVTSCHIQQSTRPAGFDKAVCDALTRNARFSPALEATGQPIKSYWRSTVRFQMMP